jgi:hypothetical protein
MVTSVEPNAEHAEASMLDVTDAFLDALKAASWDDQPAPPPPAPPQPSPPHHHSIAVDDAHAKAHRT